MLVKRILRWAGRLVVSIMVALLLFPIWHVAFTLTTALGQSELPEDHITIELGLFTWIVGASFFALYFGSVVRFHVLFLHGLALFGITWRVSVQAFHALIEVREHSFEARSLALGLNAVLGIGFLILIAEVLIMAALVVERDQRRGFIRENARPPLH